MEIISFIAMNKSIIKKFKSTFQVNLLIYMIYIHIYIYIFRNTYILFRYRYYENYLIYCNE